jgi:hypothetical protein
MFAGVSQCTIWQESFRQEQDKKQETWYWIYDQSPQKSPLEKHSNLCNKHGCTHTTHNTKDCCKYEKDKSVKADLHAAKKAGKNPNPAKQSFAQLSKKLDKLEKTLNKMSLMSKKCCTDDRDSDSE